ncbi:MULTISPECIES: Crp/Fnr family transcriptional regulator [Azospirillum]|uniref:Crp/Fnr family transcriptional regulator n=1 Tax=Azospirillum brasilense TaxID=192 RepID=A0ABU4PE86_AZOBR|nr:MULTISPECIES: Crp/Fnr family transcriptional regulator [Azospirillum]ALJ39454.1 hypothetical protein AMK58_28600 [Azospirillum brasilense]MDX5955925.1 Crp/Fnr family transcriptional regulator [Azospirillum brasilense]
MMDLNIAHLVANTPILAHLPKEESQRLVAYGEGRTFAAGDTLLLANEPAERFLIVLAGSVVLDRPADGLVPEIYGKGEPVGLEAVLEGGVQPAGAQALTEGGALIVPADSFRDHLETRFDMMLGLLAVTSARLRGTIHEITEIKLLSTTQRLASYLLGLAKAQARPGAAGPQKILLPCEKQVLAERLGMQPESLSRAFAKLRGVGLTTGRDEVVRIDSLSELARFCAELEDEFPG